MTVSYTHLDVYKRQDGIWKEAAVGNFTSILSSPNDFSLPEKKIGGYKKTITVSYTHLDVYKRQLQWKILKIKR